MHQSHATIFLVILMDEQPSRQPRYPTHVPAYARDCLEALVNQGLGDKISLGDAFGLLHYLDYRPTNDVDAWWTESATPEDQQQIIQVIESELKPFGPVRIRKWGEVVSVELVQDEIKVFSF